MRNSSDLQKQAWFWLKLGMFLSAICCFGVFASLMLVAAGWPYFGLSPRVGFYAFIPAFGAVLCFLKGWYHIISHTVGA